jgi:hypothetical protein
LAQLKETGFLEESADMVMFLYWKSFYDNDDRDTSAYQVEVAKNRNGKTGTYKLFYTPKHYRFTEDHIIPAPDVPEYKPEELDRTVQYALDLFGGKIIDPDKDIPRSNGNL